jgi:hypothetical protein
MEFLVALHRRLAFIHNIPMLKIDLFKTGVVRFMRKTTLSAVLFIALIALVAVASAALPSTVDGTLGHPGYVDSYWTVNIISGGNSDLPNSPPLYLGWCADSQVGIGTGLHTFNVYSSLDPANPSPISDANWRKINYVINHKGTLNKYEVQTIVWKYDGGEPAAGWWDTTPTSIDWTKVSTAMSAADAYVAANPTYAPGPGDVYAVILWSGRDSQDIFIEVPIPYSSPEFPSLALPVGMMLGLVSAIYVVKSREE